MKYTHFLLLLPISILLIAGCGNSDQNPPPHVDTSTSISPDHRANELAPPNPPGPVTSAQLTTNILFGDRTAVDSSTGGGGGCSNPGICVEKSDALEAIPVQFVYQKGVGGAVQSTLRMTFKYASLFGAQRDRALEFYKGTAFSPYQFGHNYDLKRLGGVFAGVTGSINATPAGAGIIAMNPGIAAPLPAPANIVTNTVTVTFKVTP